MLDTSVRAGWESPTKISLRNTERGAASLGQFSKNAMSFLSSYLSQGAKVDVANKNAETVLNMGKQVEDILKDETTETLPGPAGEGMGSDTGSNEATWETRPATAQERYGKLLGANVKNPQWMANPVTKPAMQGILKSQKELADIEMTAAKAQEALTNNAQTRQIANAGISNFRSRLAKITQPTAELNAVLAQNRVPTKKEWDDLDTLEADQVRVMATQKALIASEKASVAAQKAELQSLNQVVREARMAASDARTQARYDSLPEKERQKQLDKAEIEFAKATKLPKNVEKKNDKGKMVVIPNEDRATKMAQAQAEIDVLKSRSQPAASKTNEVERVVNGRKAVFDATTKQFIRYLD